jgi:hypothetical protein
MLDTYFKSTKQAAVEPKEEGQMMQWLDPSLAQAAHKLMVYHTIKKKVIANAEMNKREEKKASDEEEKIKHEQWLRKLHLRQSITQQSLQVRMQREKEELE